GAYVEPFGFQIWDLHFATKSRLSNSDPLVTPFRVSHAPHSVRTESRCKGNSSVCDGRYSVVNITCTYTGIIVTCVGTEQRVTRFETVDQNVDLTKFAHGNPGIWEIVGSPVGVAASALLHFIGSFRAGLGRSTTAPT